jgi:sugar/nucleoside kinase (ribokinase family)
MPHITHLEPVDYLVIGHVARDLTPKGPVLGGTVSYSALTARALGMRVGIITACEPDFPMPELDGVPKAIHFSELTTTFENIMTPSGRVQIIHHQAPILTQMDVPEVWRKTPVVHLGPIANEIDPKLARAFPDSLLCLTPQGWLRTWDDKGHVRPGEWPEAAFVLENASVAILSVEDVRGNEDWIEEMAASTRILAVTEGYNGARLYWNGDLRRFHARKVKELDPTGAGDIFATSFFYRYYHTRDPWEAARFATIIASHSVTRPGLKGVPTPQEIRDCMLEILPKI